MKLKIITIFVLGILLFGCLNPSTPIQNNTNETVSNQSNQTSMPAEPDVESIETTQALETAENFVLNSPTYAWDGSNLDLIEIYSGGDCVPGFYELFGTGQPAECVPMNQSEVFTDAYIFKFTFTSSHGGYGNRTGQFVTQAFTDHIIAVIVKNNEVMSAIIDGKWDELNQEMLPGQ